MPINTPLQAPAGVTSVADPNQSAALRQRAVEHSVDTTNRVSQQLTDQFQASAQRSHEAAMQARNIKEQKDARNQAAMQRMSESALGYINDVQAREFWAQEQDKARRITAMLEAAADDDLDDVTGGISDYYLLKSGQFNMSMAMGNALSQAAAAKRLAAMPEEMWTQMGQQAGMSTDQNGAIRWPTGNGDPNQPTQEMRPSPAGRQMGGPTGQPPMGGDSASPRQNGFIGAPPGAFTFPRGQSSAPVPQAAGMSGGLRGTPQAQDAVAQGLQGALGGAGGGGAKPKMSREQKELVVTTAMQKMGAHILESARKFNETRVDFSSIPLAGGALPTLMFHGGDPFKTMIAAIDRQDRNGAGRVFAEGAKKLEEAYGKETPKDPRGWAEVPTPVAEGIFRYFHELKEALNDAKDTIPGGSYERVMQLVRKINTIEVNYRKSQGQVTAEGAYNADLVRNAPGLLNALQSGDPEMALREWGGSHYQEAERLRKELDVLPILRIAQQRRIGIRQIKALKRKQTSAILADDMETAASIQEQIDAAVDSLSTQLQGMMPTDALGQEP